MSSLRLHYQTIEFGDTDIHVCSLRDKQEFYDPGGIAASLGICSAAWPIFGVLWPSSLVLAHYIFDYHIGTKRVLEVGCGLGLASLLLNKLNADITATDYHPETETFLVRNTQLNDGRPIAYERVAWADEGDHLGSFDLIIGSDLLYEDQHIELLANFIDRHSNPVSEIILVDPGRGRKNKFGRCLAKFGFSVTQQSPNHTGYLTEAFGGHILTFNRKIRRPLA